VLRHARRGAAIDRSRDTSRAGDVARPGSSNYSRHVVGCWYAGTGSQDFIVKDVFVPAANTCFLGDPAAEAGPLYNPRLVLAFLFTTVVANWLGIARGAIDAFIELAASDSSTAFVVLRDRPFVQGRLAEAGAILNAARACVVDSVGTLWKEVCADARDPVRAIAQVRLAIVHAMHEAVRSVDLWCFMRRERMQSIAAIHWNGISGTFMSHVQHNTAFRALRICRKSADGFAPHRYGLVIAPLI
jgi:alkylation response protein AidB-like acyl-CoA dehydrogenase